jgi:hypothetical protein
VLFVSVTNYVLAVGYGDISPSTDPGRIFCIFYAIYGVASTSVAIMAIAKYIIYNANKVQQEIRNEASRRAQNAASRMTGRPAGSETGQLGKLLDRVQAFAVASPIPVSSSVLV